ncbi:hypothetical protein NCU03403 [Neurospora crassa OR74A]|uniref:Uncharacterized protein n=1 Tax=Neurospora crassa (strain ATCC 24698 / 74-OR23-1A / CBS 708.71 / DSM 1257 / FGSC 987) TaxID=367110 RepID=Q7RY08_NEUCR|nr:hypothetical protein NCU03403 [Neurospora crassa OR74A]EAA27614.2 hypothetical protein NCU03403 [Neurospora crassa OR74A]|eukprot:XP_956850.2 hypothetical protein NCU03403 [Neurospora crassa OR74A]
MTGFCCCGVPRPPRTVTPSTPSPRNQTPKPSGALPPLPPPARLPVAGPLTSNPVIAIPLAVDAYPDSSSKSGTSLQLATSSVIVPIGPADLSDLVVEDSEDDLPGRSTEPSKSTSTLQLVRENIRRHLSQDSLPKKKSRSAVGSSQEEIQRRAELKRLMHKRIQEELRIEQSHERSRSEVSSVLPPPRSSSPDYLPGGGPRDALEFSVAQEEEGEAHSDTTSSSIAKSSADVSAPGKAAPLSDKENSCPRVNSLKYPTIAVIQKPVRERSSLPEMPASPVLAPQRYSNTIDTSSLGSWRLSYSATQLEDFLGFIDQDGSSQDAESSLKAAASRAVTSRSVPLLRRSKSETRPRSSSARTPGNATPCVLDQSPMGIWLRSQGLGSCSPSLSLGRSSDRDGDPEISVEQAKVVMLKRCSSIPNHPGGDISLQRPEIVHLHDMDIHRQLATQTLNTPEESPANTESEQNTVRRQPNGQAGLISNPSSAYPSAGHSADPSAGTSSSHLPSGVMGPHNLLSATPLRWLLPSNPFGESHSNMATGGSSLDSPTDGGTATQTELISSGVASDTINKRARPGGQDQSSSPVSISTELSAKTLESNPEPSDNVLNVAGVRRSSLESPGPEIQRPRKFPEAWARFPSYNRAERNEDHENTDQARTERIASHKPPNQEITQTAISGAISNRQHNGVMGHRQKNSMSSKFGKALKSGLDKLVHSRRSSDVSCGDSHLDQARATLEYPELALHPTEAGYRELEALGREIRRLKRLVSNEVEDGPRPWVTLPVGSDVELDGSNAGSHRNLTMPGTFPRSRGGDSSATTDKFATPLSSPSLNDASFHSFPRSYSPESSRQSSIPISNKAVVPEIKITDLSSVKSDTTLVLRTHQVRFSDENGQCQSDSATSGSSKYNTWSGPNDSQTIDDANESDDSDQVFPTNNKRGSHLENSLSIQEIAAGNV